MIHSLGFDDAGLQTALDRTVDPTNKKPISNKLEKDCVHGEGNN